MATFRPPTIASLSAIIILIGAATSQSCYFPDGSLSNGIPCNSGLMPGQHSSCCGSGWYCTGANLCQAMNNLTAVSRGACTDPEFEDPACPKFCTAKYQQWWVSFRVCYRNTTNTFGCCNYEFPSQCECWSDPTFELGSLESPSPSAPQGSQITLTPTILPSSFFHHLNVESATVTIPISTTLSGASHHTSTSKPTNNSGGLSTGAKAGIGIGVALGLSLAGLVGFCLWRTRDQKYQQTEHMKEVVTSPSSRHTFDTKASMSYYGDANDLEDRHEIDGQQIYEADGRAVHQHHSDAL